MLDALKAEIHDPRTWETQYQMIMAIAECCYAPALAFLHELAGQRIEATMVYVAIGDALVRLGSTGAGDAAPALEILRRYKEPMLIDGALRALAMLRLVPDEPAQREILDFARAFSPDHHLRFWVTAAAPGWTAPPLENFLDECGRSSRSDIRDAAALARLRKYKKWNPL